MGKRFLSSDVFGDKFCNDILRPIVVRMNGAEPEETYIENLGSNLRMLKDSYEQLRITRIITVLFA